MLAIRLDKQIEMRLEAIAEKTGRTKTWYARKAIETYLDDLEDAALAAAAYEEYLLEWACRISSVPARPALATLCA